MQFSLKNMFTLIIAGVILGLVAFFILRPDPIIRFLKSNHLLPEPEKLTELYFEDHTKLPNSITPGKEETFRFTIHNLEYEPMHYPYVIQVEKGGDIKNAATGTVDLDHDGFKTISQSLTFEEATRTGVRVTLLDKDQSIHFWLNNN